MTTERIYEKTLARLGVTAKQLRSRRHRQAYVDARSLVAAVLMQQPFMRQQDVATLLGTSQSAVSQLLVRHKNLLEVDFDYQRKWRTVCSRS